MSQEKATAQCPVFVSYSHQDAEYLKQLQTCLAPLVMESGIDLWSDQRVEIGEEWNEEIQAALAHAKVAIILLSQNFLASKYIRNDELPQILERVSEGGLTVLTIVVRAVPQNHNKQIFKFQAANDPNKPLNAMQEHERDAIWVKVFERVEKLLPPQ